MEIRIGVTQSGRELSFETSDSATDLKKTVAEAFDTDAKVVEFTDTKGNSYLVPTTGIAYIEFGTEDQRRVGFVA